MVNDTMESAPSPKRNKRLLKGTSHVGGAMSSVPSDVPSGISLGVSSGPLHSTISDEEVKQKRTARENREDNAAAFGGY